MTDNSKTKVYCSITISLVLILVILSSPVLSSTPLVPPEAATFTTLPSFTTITLIPFYSLSVKPVNITIDPGEQIQAIVTIGSFWGYNKTVSLFSVVPSGISITFALSKLTPPVGGNISTTAFISVDKDLASGTHNAFINATDGSAKKGVKLKIVVNPVATTTPTTTTVTTTTTKTTTPTTTSSSTTTKPTTSTTTTPTTTITTSPITTSTTTTVTTTTSSGGSDMTLIIVLVIIILIVVAIAIFFMRKKPSLPTEPPKRYCMHCGTGMTGDAFSCPKCGKQPAGGPDTKVCPNCSAVINIVASFCPKCGAAQPKENDKSGATSS